MRGFTLLETLIAMLIVAVLSSLAVPGYQQVMHKARRIEARTALLQIQFLQERHYLNHFAYSDSLAGSPADGGLGSATTTPSGDYTLFIETRADGQGYVAYAQATPAGRQAGDRSCRLFSIDAVGTVRSAPDNGPWRTDTGTCWA